MGRHVIDLTGQRFGRLVVIGRADPPRGKHGEAMWHCCCDCGGEKDVASSGLRTGRTASCGCLRRSDLTGRRFGRLVVIGPADPPVDKRHRSRWRCKCDCGREKDVVSAGLCYGTTISCGCAQRELASAASIIHGQYKSRLYRIWESMLARCENQHNSHYENYGGRGITVCEEWHDFVNFMQWAVRMGYQENLTIDRINVHEGYTPINCRWATMHEQSRNKRTNHNITYNGVTRCLTDWAATLGMSVSGLRRRINRYGGDIERAFATPVQKQYSHPKQKEQVAS